MLRYLMKFSTIAGVSGVYLLLTGDNPLEVVAGSLALLTAMLYIIGEDVIKKEKENNRDGE